MEGECYGKIKEVVCSRFHDLRERAYSRKKTVWLTCRGKVEVLFSDEAGLRVGSRPGMDLVGNSKHWDH